MTRLIIVIAVALTGCRSVYATPSLPAFSTIMVSAQPTPTPSDAPITDDEVRNIPKAQIVAMLKHEHDIMVAAVAQNQDLIERLKEASSANTLSLTATSGALIEIPRLNKELGTVIAHDASETARANKLDKALWWYRVHWWGAWIMLGLGVAACLFFAFLKFTGRLSLSAAQVAAKL